MWALNRLWETAATLWCGATPAYDPLDPPAAHQPLDLNNLDSTNISPTDLIHLLAENDFLHSEREHLQDELRDMYVELGHARKTECMLSDELQLRREALADLSEINAGLRDDFACSRVAEIGHEADVAVLKAENEQLRAQLAEAKRVCKEMEAILESQTKDAGMLLEGVEGLVERVCSKIEVVRMDDLDTGMNSAGTAMGDTSIREAGATKAGDGVGVGGDPAASNCSPVRGSETGDVLMRQGGSADVGDDVDGGLVVGNISPVRVKGVHFSGAAAPEKTLPPPLCRSMAQETLAMHVDVPPPERSMNEALRQELDLAMQSFQETNALMKEVSTIAARTKKENAELRRTIACVVERVDQLAGRKALSGKQVEPIARVLRNVLLV